MVGSNVTGYSFEGVKVSLLPGADPLTGNEDVIVKQAGVLKRVSTDELISRMDDTLDNRQNTSYLPVTKNSIGYSEDLAGRVVYQNDLLKGKSGYLVESRQLGIKFNPEPGIDIAYNVGAGSFTVLLPGFALLDNSHLFVWINLAKNTGSGSGGGDLGGIQGQLDDHETRIEALEAGGGNPVPLVLTATVDGQTQFNIFKVPTSLSYLVVNGSEYFKDEDYTISTIAGNVVLTWVNTTFTLSMADNIKLFKN